MSATLFSIGHSNHPLEAFVALLRRHAVTAVVDVRSSPYSRYNPQFNQASLQAALQAEGLAYVYLGDQLGGRTEDPDCLQDGRPSYWLMARSERFRAGIERVEREAREHRLALMCAEKVPSHCHRALLVSRALAARGLEVQHILADGRLEPHEEVMDRLLDQFDLPREDLYRSREALEDEAVARALAKWAARRRG